MHLVALFGRVDHETAAEPENTTNGSGIGSGVVIVLLEKRIARESLVPLDRFVISVDW
jgi:hypothetical protein